ncbi:MAG: hypothetical protein IKJ19_07295 [Clostridia bacterium]|nr:hypothetical protein [Clostridia bacterium]
MFNKYDLTDFERRLSNLEKRIARATFCHFLEQKEGKSAMKKHTFDFEFVVHAKTYLKVKCIVHLKSECSFKLKLLLNEAFANEWELSGKDGTIEFLLPVSEGVNKVSILVESDNQIEVQDCIFETFGNIGYSKDDYQLLHLIYNDATFIILYQNGNAILKKYQNGEFVFIKEWQKIRGIAICKLKENILISYINQNGDMIAELYNYNFKMIESNVLDNGIISICAISGELATLLAVKGNTVYKYMVLGCHSFEKIKTEYKGKRVQSNPDVNLCIITDFNGFAKLVTI